jgi:hypothetical protein
MRGLLGRFLALVSWAPCQASDVGARPTARAFLPQSRAVPSFRALDGGGGAIHWYGLAGFSLPALRQPQRCCAALVPVESKQRSAPFARFAHQPWPRPPATLPSPPPTISRFAFFPAPPFMDAKLAPYAFLPLSSCSRSSSSTRHPRPPLRRCRPPGLGGGLMPRSHLPPTPNPRRGPVMLTCRMRKTRSCASGSAWRPSTESGPGSSPPSMYAPLASP